MAILDDRQQRQALQQWLQQLAQQRLSVCNGCFDLLHPGHIKFLQEAAQQGERLLVMLSADEDVRQFKGASRPILHEQARAQMLDAMACVDVVLIYSAEQVWHLYQLMQPHCIAVPSEHAEHQDYVAKLQACCERLHVVARDGDGWSTSDIIQHIKADTPIQAPLPVTNQAI